ncbi:MAG: ABC transporter permease [Bacteroidia bacterium]
MTIFLLALKNIRYRWMTQFITILLIALGIAMLWTVREVQVQGEDKLQKNLASIDLVVGAKGSPLQLILASIYHIDAPTGNIPYSEALRLSKHPMVKEAVPLAYGDYCQEFRILGTSHAYLDWYGVSLQDGKLWAKTGETCLGSEAAKTLNLKIGDTFSGQHGDREAEAGHGEYVVTGILAPSGTVVDQLILCSISSVWAVHEEGHGAWGIEHGVERPTVNGQRSTVDSQQTTVLHGQDDGHEITSLLIRYKNKMAAMRLPRMINENTSMQAAAPAIEINRLSFMLNQGSDTLKLVGYALLLLALFSMLVQVWMGLEERKTELALLRSMGFGRLKLLAMLFLELSMTVMLAYLLGEFAGRWFLANFSSELGYGLAYRFDTETFGIFDVQLLLMPLLVAFLAVLVNTRKIYRISISDLLQKA